VEEPPALPEPPPISIPEPPRIGLRNGLAVRVGLAAGGLGLLVSLLLGQVPGLQLIIFLAPAASGFLAVLLYEKRSGQKLSVSGGAHLGWIAGIFGFIVISLMFSAAVLTEPDAMAILREQAVKSRPDMAEAIRSFPPSAFIMSVEICIFLLFGLLPAFGGALGAKLLDRK